jgi:hypothetical protein
MRHKTKNNDTDANAKFETKLDTTKIKLLSLDQKLLGHTI